MLIGTFCMLSSRFCAVTTMSLLSSTGAAWVSADGADCAKAGAAKLADASKAAMARRRLETSIVGPRYDMNCREGVRGRSTRQSHPADEIISTADVTVLQ